MTKQKTDGLSLWLFSTIVLLNFFILITLGDYLMK